jgi:hypothetical protein
VSRRRIALPRVSLSWGLLWKLLGLAGLAGVAASGAVTARAERRRRAYTPDEVRARLRERAAAAQDDHELGQAGTQQPGR